MGEVRGRFIGTDAQALNRDSGSPSLSVGAPRVGFRSTPRHGCTAILPGARLTASEGSGTSLLSSPHHTASAWPAPETATLVLAIAAGQRQRSRTTTGPRQVALASLGLHCAIDIERETREQPLAEAYLGDITPGTTALSCPNIEATEHVPLCLRLTGYCPPRRPGAPVPRHGCGATGLAGGGHKDGLFASTGRPRGDGRRACIGLLGCFAAAAACGGSWSSWPSSGWHVFSGVVPSEGEWCRQAGHRGDLRCRHSRGGHLGYRPASRRLGGLCAAVPAGGNSGLPFTGRDVAGCRVAVMPCRWLSLAAFRDVAGSFVFFCIAARA